MPLDDSTDAVNTNLRLFDAHLHLQDSRFGNQLEKVLEEAKAAGVQRFACNGCCEADWEQVLQISQQHKEVVPNFGLHPWWVGGRSHDWLQKLRQKLECCPGAGLGECGLHRGKQEGLVDLEEQAVVMAQQLQLAKELERPASVHCVNAFGKLAEILQREAPFPSGLVLHSWAGNAELVKQFSKADGIYFSISGHICSLAEKKRQPLLQQIPLDRLLLETDAPDGLPSGPGTQTISDARNTALKSLQPLNHPANIRVVLEVVAEATGISRVEIAAAAFKNASRVFSI